MRALNPRGAYGIQIAKCFHMQSAPHLILPFRNRSEMAVTRLHSLSGLAKPTSALFPEKSFIVAIQMVKPDCRGWGTWSDGKFSPVESWPEGGIGIFDLESNPIALRPTAFDTIHFYLPRSTLDAFTNANDLKAIGNLRCQQGTHDRVMHHLSQMIVPHLTDGVDLPSLVADYFTLMLCGHIVGTYSSVSQAPKRWRGGLAPWQKRRATDLLQTDLNGDLRLSRLANECGLSVTHFARSFKTSFGTTLHRYLLTQRVEAAKELLLHSDQPLAQIALQVGFSDQTTFCRTFSGMVGSAPGRWRRERRHNSFHVDWKRSLHPILPILTAGPRPYKASKSQFVS